MAKKIEIIGNSLVITDTSTNEVVFDAPKIDYYYVSEDLDKGFISLKAIDITNVRFRTPKISLSTAVDSTDTTFTKESFEDWARLNLGTSGITIRAISQTDYDNLVVVDPNVLYIVNN